WWAGAELCGTSHRGNTAATSRRPATPLGSRLPACNSLPAEPDANELNEAIRIFVGRVPDIKGFTGNRVQIFSSCRRTEPGVDAYTFADHPAWAWGAAWPQRGEK